MGRWERLAERTWLKWASALTATWEFLVFWVTLRVFRRGTCRGLSVSVFLANPLCLREPERRRLPRSPRNPLQELSRVSLLSHPGAGLPGCVFRGGSEGGRDVLGDDLESFLEEEPHHRRGRWLLPIEGRRSPPGTRGPRGSFGVLEAASKVVGILEPCSP